MKLFQAIIYPFKERGWWRRLGVAILMAAIPVAGFFLIKGWEFEISVRVRHNQSPLIPGWKPFWKKLGRGLLLRFVGLLHNIPTLVMLGLNTLLWLERFMKFFNQSPRPLTVLIAILLEGLPLRLVVALLTLIVALAANTLYWSGYLRYIDTRRVASFLDIATNLRLAFANFWDDLLVAIFLSIAGLFIGGLDSLLIGLLAFTGVGELLAPVIVPALTFTFLSTVSGHLFGQLASRTLEKRDV